MATYYNGIEITNSRTISGVSLAGKSSFEFSGKTINLSTPPITITLYGRGDYGSPGNSCAVGPTERQFIVAYVIGPNRDGTYSIFKDSGLLIPFNDGIYYSKDTTSIGGAAGSYWVEISGGVIDPTVPQFDIC